MFFKLTKYQTIMQLIFQSELDALAVAEQLYMCERVGETLIVDDHDCQALELAIALVQASNPYSILPEVIDSKCNLPFPRHERECNTQCTPKIYVVCLSAYNSGFLHGLWIDATQEVENIEEDINWMLSWSPMPDNYPYEEWAIHCCENFKNFSIRKYESLEYVSKLAQVLGNSEDAGVIAKWLDYAKNRVMNLDTRASTNSYYCNHWKTEHDFIWQSCEIQKMYELVRTNM